MRRNLWLCIIIFFFNISVFPKDNLIFADFSPQHSFLIKITDLKINDSRVSLILKVVADREKDYTIYRLTIPNIVINDKNISGVKGEIVQKKDNFFIRYIKSNNILLQGKYSLNNDLPLDIKILFYRLPLDRVNGIFRRLSMQGILKGNLRLYGDIDNLFSEGKFDIDNGNFLGHNFYNAQIRFKGSIPLLKLYDSHIFFTKEMVFSLEGFIDIMDMANLFVNPTYESERVPLGDWKIVSPDGKNNVVLNKDDEVYIVLDSSVDNTDLSKESAEVKYKLGKNKFIKMRLEGERSIIGLEQRKEF